VSGQACAGCLPRTSMHGVRSLMCSIGRCRRGARGGSLRLGGSDMPGLDCRRGEQPRPVSAPPAAAHPLRVASPRVAGCRRAPAGRTSSPARAAAGAGGGDSQASTPPSQPPTPARRGRCMRPPWPVPATCRWGWQGAGSGGQPGCSGAPGRRRAPLPRRSRRPGCRREGRHALCCQPTPAPGLLPCSDLAVCAAPAALGGRGGRSGGPLQLGVG